MGPIPGMTVSTPPDPSQRIPDAARGRVRRKKKASAGSETATVDASTEAMATASSIESKDDERRPYKDNTFVTSRRFQDEGIPEMEGGIA